MTQGTAVALLWLFFGGSHVGLAMARPRLVTRVGEIGFTAIFSVVASASFAALVTYYPAHCFEGAPGLALGVGALVAGFNAWRRSRRLAAGPPLGAAATARNP